MVTLRYSWIGAYEHGIRKSPLEDLKDMGYEVLWWEAMGIADCTFVKVKEIIGELPPYLEESNFEFTRILQYEKLAKRFGW